jgi:hypothetical protein
METDPAELERAGQTIHRLEGARAELLAGTQHGREISRPRPCPVPHVHGKLDAWVIGAGGLAIASFLVGTVFGARAIALQARGDQASSRDSAVLADLALATSLLSGAGTVALYWGRYADVPPSHAPVAFVPRSGVAQFEYHF